MLKRIHINQHVIKKNNKTGERKKCITVKTSKTNDYCHEVEIKGPCMLIYSPDKPLSCGARVWIETKAEVRVYSMESRPRENNFNKTVLVERIIK